MIFFTLHYRERNIAEVLKKGRFDGQVLTIVPTIAIMLFTLAPNPITVVLIIASISASQVAGDLATHEIDKIKRHEILIAYNKGRHQGFVSVLPTAGAIVATLASTRLSFK